MNEPISDAERHQLEVERKDQWLVEMRERDRQQLLAQLSPGEHREEGVPLLAWCGNVAGGCDVTQEPVSGVRITTNRTYRENGGDATGPMASMIETTLVRFDFLNDDDRYCRKCGKQRELSDQARTPYPPMSGHDQNGLLKIAQGWTRGDLRPPMGAGVVFQAAKEPDDRVADLERELAELRALVNGRPSDSKETNGTPDTPVPEPPDLPAGIRPRGDGSYQAYWRDADGKQRSATRRTLEEAVSIRQHRIDEAAELRTNRGA